MTGPGAGSLTVDRNDISCCAAAFPMGAGGDLTLAGLTVTGAYRGVYYPDFDGTASVTLLGSTVSGNDEGLRFNAHGTVTLTDSTLSGNDDGLHFDSSEPGVAPLHGHLMIGFE